MSEEYAQQPQANQEPTQEETDKLDEHLKEVAGPVDEEVESPVLESLTKPKRIKKKNGSQYEYYKKKIEDL